MSHMVEQHGAETSHRNSGAARVPERGVADAQGAAHGDPGDDATEFKPAHLAAWAILAFVLAVVIGAAMWPRGGAPVVLPSQMAGPTIEQGLPILFEAPVFALVDQNGRAVTNADFVGRVWIADFIFTYCAGPCPLMTQKMAGLQEALSDCAPLRLVSFSVDPARDRPDVLAAYAARFGADSQRWLFLTGDDERGIRRMIGEGFRLVARVTTPEERADQGWDDILHSTQFVLVDERGRIRGLYDSNDARQMTQLQRDTRRLCESVRR